jgi:Universal stress protein family
VRRIEEITSLVPPKVRFKMLHIGSQQPVIIYNEGRVLPIELRPGVRSASEMGTGLIAMPKEGRHGLSDALFRTTTERVLYEASCPVLAVTMFRGQ